MRGYPRTGACALLLALALSLHAQPSPDTSALLSAVARAPALEAARHRLAAAQTRTEAAGRLADPELEAMASRVAANTMGPPSDMYELTLRQPLPKRGERAADRDRATAAVSMAAADYALAAGELAADVASSLAAAEAAQARARLYDTQRTRFVIALRTLDVRLAAGVNVTLAERLTLQSRLAALELARDQAQVEADDALAAARGRLGLAPGSTLPAFSAPVAADITPEDSALVASALARRAEADAMGRMARASANPGTSIGVRLERERSRMGHADTLGVAVSTDLPFRSRGYARTEIRAAAADRAAAEAEADAARYRVAATVSRVERAERLAATARRLAEETEKRLATEHDVLSRAVSVSAAAGGMGAQNAVLHAVDMLEKSTEAQLQIVDAEASARTARSELWRLLPAYRLSNLVPVP